LHYRRPLRIQKKGFLLATASAKLKKIKTLRACIKHTPYPETKKGAEQSSVPFFSA
jgi:hypothetical protein